MTDQPPTPAPAKPARAKTDKPKHRLSPALRIARDIGPYALALGVFAISAGVTLNTTAAHYADEIFTLALVLIRATNPPPPTPPAA